MESFTRNRMTIMRKDGNLKELLEVLFFSCRWCCDQTFLFLLQKLVVHNQLLLLNNMNLKEISFELFVDNTIHF